MFALRTLRAVAHSHASGEEESESTEAPDSRGSSTTVGIGVVLSPSAWGMLLFSLAA